MLKKILVVVALVLMGFLAAVSMRPDTMHVERKTMITAPAEVVFSFLNDFKEWSKWNPWDRLDPNMQKTYSGPATGVGAGYGWKGNDQVGEGRMTILEAKPGEKVAYKLEFIKPFSANNATAVMLAPAAGGTATTWTMDGEQSFGMKLAGMFMDMDKSIGGDFDRGLANLKGLAEAKAKEGPAAAAPTPAAPAAPAAAPVAK